jgi:hypothetical protein
MSDGDIWGSGRLTTKWLAAGSQREHDIARALGVSQELADLTARALADTLRHANRQPCEAVVDALIRHREADTVTWHSALEQIENEWGSRDAQIACRAAIAVRSQLPPEATAEECTLAYHASYAARACDHLEEAVNARIGCEDTPSALLPEHTLHFARQLAKGAEGKIIAPRRKAPPKETNAILEMDVL